MNGPAPRRLSRRGGAGRRPGSLCRGPAGGAGRRGLRRPSLGLGGPAASTHHPLRAPEGGRSPPFGSPPTPEPDPNPYPGSAEQEEPLDARAAKFGDSGGVVATPEPFPRRGQMSGGPGEPATSPRCGAGSPQWRLEGAGGTRAARERRGPEPAAHVRARELPLGARRCPLQSLQQHSPMAAARARRSPPMPDTPPAARAPGAARPRSGLRAVPSLARGCARGHRPGRSLPLTLRPSPAPRASRPPGRPC